MDIMGIRAGKVAEEGREDTGGGGGSESESEVEGE